MGCLDFPLAFFLPATLGACAVCVSILGSFLCKFVSLKEVTSNRDVFIGIWLRTKLYYVKDEEDGTWNVYKGCGSYGGEVNFDGYWNSAKAFSIIACVIGAIVVLVVIFSACLPVTSRTWKFMGFTLVFTSLFQGLTLLFLSGNACTENGRTLFTDLATLEFADGCNLASGANMCISATVLWFVSGVLVCVIPCPNEALDNELAESEPSKKQVPVIDDKPEEGQVETPAQDEAPTTGEETEAP